MQPTPSLIDKAKLFLVHYYGPENPKRAWIWIMTICVIMFFPRSSRRWGGIGFFVALFLYYIFDWLAAVFKNFTPS